MTIKEKKIGFLGAGNMAEALIRGLLKTGLVPPEAIFASDVRLDRLEELGKLYGIHTLSDNALLVKRTDVVILAVKPQVIRAVAEEVRSAIRRDTLVISIAAGVSGDTLRRHLPEWVRLIRTNRGILAGTDLRAALDLDCSRCLREVAMPVDVRFQEEYLPSLDLATGRALPPTDEPDVLRLTDHHELDLETPVREALQLAEPIAPLCRPDCPGLCIVCGRRLDEGTHDHPDDEIDPRLEALHAFRSYDA